MIDIAYYRLILIFSLSINYVWRLVGEMEGSTRDPLE